MQGLSRIAKAYYKHGSPELKKEAHKFFNSLDGDGDGHVDKDEFVSFMTKRAGYRSMSSPAWSDEFDTDGNGTLDFWEVLTILNIFKSGRPFCDACNKLCLETYFTCLECPDYDQCLSCYEKGKSGHNHQFMDNYALLAYKKRRSHLNNNNANTTTTGSSNNNTQLAIVPANNKYVSTSIL